MKSPLLLPTLVLSLLLGACQSTPSQPEKAAPAAKPAPAAAKPAEAAPPAKPADTQTAPPTKAEARLAGGVRLYEDGDYKGAQAYLQAALDEGLTSKADQARANKYLAFIACTAGQRDLCKRHFVAVLAVSPKFRLTKAEAGHPIWGPVFNEAKAEAGKKTSKPKK